MSAIKRPLQLTSILIGVMLYTITSVLLIFLDAFRTHSSAEENYYETAEVKPVQEPPDEAEEIKKAPMIGIYC